MAEWGTLTKTNMLLADIFDAINTQTAVIVSWKTGKQFKSPKHYPRPNDNKDKKHVGSKPLPVPKLEDWFEERRRAYNERKHRGS